jgi:hypothetical protein
MQPEGITEVGTPRASCSDAARKEARMLEIYWWAAAMNRVEWRKLLQRAETLRAVSMMMMTTTTTMIHSTHS